MVVRGFSYWVWLLIVKRFYVMIVSMFCYTCSNSQTLQKINMITCVLLFPVNHNTHRFFCRLQSNVFDAMSLFQTGNHMVDWNASREDIPSVWHHDFFILCDIHSRCLSSRGKLTVLFFCLRTVGMATVYQLKIK